MIKDIKYIKVWERWLENASDSTGNITGKYLYKLTGIIDTFSSAIFNQQCSTIGDFEIVLPVTEHYKKLLHVDGADDTTTKLNDFNANTTAGATGGLNIMFTVDGINDIFVMESLRFERGNNNEPQIVVTGANLFGLFKGLFVGENHAILVDGITVYTMDSVKPIVLTWNYDTKQGMPLYVLGALLANGWKNYFSESYKYGTSSDYNVTGNEQYACGYKVQINTASLYVGKYIKDDDNTIINPYFEVGQLIDHVLKLCEKYTLGIIANMSSTNDGYFMPSLTLFDIGIMSEDIFLNDKLPIVTNPTLEIDVAGITEKQVVLGSKNTEKNYYTYNTDTGYMDNSRLFAGRKQSMNTNATNSESSYTSAYQKTLGQLAKENRKRRVLQTIAGEINLSLPDTDPIIEKLVLGTRYYLSVFGRTTIIYISGFTYAKDTAGLNISCEYSLPITEI